MEAWDEGNTLQIEQPVCPATATAFEVEDIRYETPVRVSIL